MSNAQRRLVEEGRATIQGGPQVVRRTRSINNQLQAHGRGRREQDAIVRRTHEDRRLSLPEWHASAQERQVAVLQPADAETRDARSAEGQEAVFTMSCIRPKPGQRVARGGCGSPCCPEPREHLHFMDPCCAPGARLNAPGLRRAGIGDVTVPGATRGIVGAAIATIATWLSGR